ncbi:histidine kinase [Marivirga sp. S37H4]|uniref:Histidine kinase n=1 Tax=Marivirga aurantiaca TaxID=2802615 RepID=A0A934WYQ4_9BACT|nr:sensor histidine kinase [Marivirga aurantiaca]MBK6265327.1 histidine kinase [Marivirga aurantiaca]
MNKKVLIHGSIWLVYLCYDLLTRILLKIPLDNLHLILYNLLSSVAIFYLFPGFIFPGFNKKINKLASFLKFIISFGIFLLVRHLFDTYVFDVQMDFTEFVISESLRFIYFGLLGTGYWFTKSYIKSLKEKKEIELQSVRDRLEISNNKISPHFLFNTLNLIHGDIYSSSPEVSEKIIVLSDILRYSLNKDNELVGVVEEINIMKSYLHLQNIRFNNSMFIQLKLSLNHEHSCIRLPKMLLINVLENIFIHGIYNDVEKSPLVAIETSKNKFQLHIENKINNLTRKSPSGGVGMSHIDKSLNYFFKGQYTFDKQISSDTFNLNITINY